MPLLSCLQSLRRERKKSRFKIWLRAGLFVLFGLLFTLYFIRNIADGYFKWQAVALLFILFVPVGFWLSRKVPMQVDLQTKAVTLSLDRFYLVLIWILVMAKWVTSRLPSWITLSDIIMCAILGITFGRLGGIGLRVRQLTNHYKFGTYHS